MLAVANAARCPAWQVLLTASAGWLLSVPGGTKKQTLGVLVGPGELGEAGPLIERTSTLSRGARKVHVTCSRISDALGRSIQDPAKRRVLG